MFGAIQEKTLYIFGACNFSSIVMVLAFYPETANRTLEEIDDLFSANMPFNWDAEKAFKEAKRHNYTKKLSVSKEKADPEQYIEISAD